MFPKSSIIGKIVNKETHKKAKIVKINLKNTGTSEFAGKTTNNKYKLEEVKPKQVKKLKLFIR